MQTEFITMYFPIFREKLAKLEARGQGRCAEALRLRKAIATVEDSEPEPTPDPEFTEAA